MSAAVLIPSKRFDLTSLWQRSWAANWPLTLVGLGNLLILVAALVGLIVDERVITGAPAWLKPMKFAISIAIYSFTFVWLLGFVKTRPRLAQMAATLTAIGFVIEMVIIVGQAARGTTSHFNNQTPLDRFLFATMGFFILIVWLMNLLAAVLLLCEKIEGGAFAWGLRFGLWVALAGAAVGVLMVVPTSAQLADIAATGSLPITGAHAVGVRDGGPGLPMVGWSTEGGDLRAPHFFGMHAMQFLPLLGWWLQRRKKMRESSRVGLIWTAAVGYGGMIIILVWQALRAQPLLAPDGLTLGAIGALLVGVAAMAVIFIKNSRLKTQ
jgi:hypothetical protein